MTTYTFYIETEDGEIREVEYLCTPTTIYERYKECLKTDKTGSYDLESFIEATNSKIKDEAYKQNKKGFYLSKNNKITDYKDVVRVWVEATIEAK